LSSRRRIGQLGIGCGIEWRKEELEDAVEARGPGVFVVESAGDAEVVEVDVVAPAALEEAAVEGVGVAEMAEAFGGAHIQPDAGMREVGRLGSEARTDAGGARWNTAAEPLEHAAVVPPDAGREDGEAAEDLRVLEAEGERDEAAEGAAAEAGVRGAIEQAEALGDEGQEFLDEEAAVELAFAAAAHGVAGGCVLGHAADAGVVDADEDEGLDAAFASEAVGGGVGAPGAAGKVRGAGVEEVLAVVKVEDGEVAAGIGGVGLGEVDADAAGFGVGQEARVEQEGLVAGIVVELTGSGGRILRGGGWIDWLQGCELRRMIAARCVGSGLKVEFLQRRVQQRGRILSVVPAVGDAGPLHG
jgi:hypothetical protein